VEIVLGAFENTNARDFKAVMDAFTDDVVLALRGKLRALGGESAVGKKGCSEANQLAGDTLIPRGVLKMWRP
jgi:ketosteroid isomerase-like protein